MTDGKTQQEPSMEEILASIRRIISEEGEPESPQERQSGGESADVLELTQMVQDDGSTVDLAERQAAPQGTESEPPAERGAQAERETETEPEREAEPQAKPEPEAAPEAASGTVHAGAEEEPAEAPAAAEPAAATASAPERQAQPEVSASEREAAAKERLVGDSAAAASMKAFAELARAVEPPRESSSSALRFGESGRTIEELVVELMRPMLREWLDQNLPGLVERIVQREIRDLMRRAEPD